MVSKKKLDRLMQKFAREQRQQQKREEAQDSELQALMDELKLMQEKGAMYVYVSNDHPFARSFDLDLLVGALEKLEKERIARLGV